MSLIHSFYIESFFAKNGCIISINIKKELGVICTLFTKTSFFETWKKISICVDRTKNKIDFFIFDFEQIQKKQKKKRINILKAHYFLIQSSKFSTVKLETQKLTIVIIERAYNLGRYFQWGFTLKKCAKSHIENANS